MHANTYAVTVVASIAKIIASVNAVMIVTPALAFALHSERAKRRAKNDDSKLFETKFLKFQILRRIAQI